MLPDVVISILVTAVSDVTIVALAPLVPDPPYSDIGVYVPALCVAFRPDVLSNKALRPVTKALIIVTRSSSFNFMVKG